MFMRKSVIITISALMLAMAGRALASGISSFDQKINVKNDGTFAVTETVLVNFDEERHGIYRDIPVNYKTDAGNPFSIKVKVDSVTDENGTPLTYAVGKSGGDLEIKIGDPNTLITGKREYVITYEVSRALLFLADQDQLYWNVSTEAWSDLGWPAKASAEVTLPSSVGGDKIQTRCFTGLGAGASEDCTMSKSADGAAFANAGAYDGAVLTIVVGWPKGVVREPSTFDEFLMWLGDNWILIIPIFAFAFLFWRWWKFGRDPKMTGPVIVEYEPTDGATPAELAVLEKGSGGMPEISATIVHLAVKGYLVIEESEKKNIIGTSRSYVFELKKEFASDASLADFERVILDNIFDGTVGERVNLNDLENKFYTALPGIKSAMSDAAVKRGWYKASPARVRGAYFGVAGGLAFAAYIVSRAFVGSSVLGPTGYASLFAPAVLTAIFGYFMPARTPAGNAAYMKTLGFKEFISKAEKYRAKWEEKENIFSDYLPYAMIFGVADKWAKAFEGLDKNPPSWYRGAPGLVWSPLFFASSMTSAASSFGRSLAVAPSARGGGGFGGGGFGGGGFGGGGGGSW
jgi:uncharacterized membrane protein YgcG